MKNTSSDSTQSSQNIPFFLIQGQNARVEDLNSRIYERNLSDIDLAPNFDPRPHQTKYSVFPRPDAEYKSPPIREKTYLDYYTELMFHPGNTKGPVDGYFHSVPTETNLRNQHIPLHHGDLGIQYIPSMNSDMYHIQVAKSSIAGPMPSTHLFDTYQHDPAYSRSIPSATIGNNAFYNHTRTQLRDL